MDQVRPAGVLSGSVEEEQWVQRAQAGDAGAFECLVYAHNRFVYNLALRALGDPAEAEDVTQEAFLRAWQALPSFRRQARFRTWLYRITVNLCYNRLPHLRQALEAVSWEAGEDGSDPAGVGETPAMPAADDPGPEDALLQAERRERLRLAVAGLPEGYRMLVQLRFQQDLSYEEIATVMQLPLGTVKTHLFRARQQLRQALEAVEKVSA